MIDTIIIIVLFFSSRLGTVPAIQIPTRSSVPLEGTWGKTQHGHNNRRIPLLDVAGTQLSDTLPFLRVHLSAVQRLLVVQAQRYHRDHVACPSTELHVFTAVRGQFIHYNSNNL
ncbi:unnamed protein product [Callosobruchus maculatus]|uniref:Secreted protein n=1 Tax=Callosobruchus maculatus TaxID=64391 RepID=A0A653CDL6_CALMS|nr:unnamed protein product [Callosobruchus maculatus]